MFSRVLSLRFFGDSDRSPRECSAAVLIPWRRKTQMIAFLSLLTMMLPLSVHAAGNAQLALPSGDLVAPEVVHEVGREPLVPGQPYTISVKATDNVGVKQVLLYYRSIGSGDDYKRVLLKNVEPSKYTVTLPGAEIVNPGIEYYVQTEDLAGNTLLTGYSFSPLVVKSESTVSKGEAFASMSAGASVAEALNPAGTDGANSADPIWKNKWLWIGVAAVAGIALSSGGDSGNPGTKTDTNGVTITACLPQTSQAGCP